VSEKTVTTGKEDRRKPIRKLDEILRILKGKAPEPSKQKSLE
jgi:hypothetical protein